MKAAERLYIYSTANTVYKACLLATDVTNVEAELLKNTAGDPAQVAELQARVKELEMEQSLMQRELDNMSYVAQRTDNQLRFD